MLSSPTTYNIPVCKDTNQGVEGVTLILDGASLVAGVSLSLWAKRLKIQNDILLAANDSRAFLYSGGVPNLLAEIAKVLKKVSDEYINFLNSKQLTTLASKLLSITDEDLRSTWIAEHIGASDDVLKKLNSNPGLVDTWMKIKELTAFRNDLEFLLIYELIVNDEVFLHIVDGDIEIVTNLQGIEVKTAAGVHYIPAGNDETKIKIVDGSVQNLPNGYYKAAIEIKDPVDGWILKEKVDWAKNVLIGGPQKSTCFPKEWSIDKLKEELTFAFKNKIHVDDFKWQGITSDGRKITILYDEQTKKILSIFPK